MVRAEVIRKRLNRLDEYLSILRSQQKYSFEEFTHGVGVGGSELVWRHPGYLGRKGLSWRRSERDIGKSSICQGECIDSY